MIRPKTADEIEYMREGGRKLAAILGMLSAKAEPGATGKDISAIATQEIKKAKMKPVVLGYQGFPDVMCVSVNNAIVHGVPTKTPFKNGDVVKLDLTLGYKAMVIDSALTIVVGGEPSGDVQRLLDGTKKALDAGINAIKGDGTRVGDISSAVQNVLEKHKLGVIRDLVGHGVGYAIHEEPNVPNFGVAGTGPLLSAGMTLAIEPMAALGDWQINMKKDGTVLMRDGSIGAHFEHTVLVTEDGAEILTAL